MLVQSNNQEQFTTPSCALSYWQSCRKNILFATIVLHKHQTRFDTSDEKTSPQNSNTAEHETALVQIELLGCSIHNIARSIKTGIRINTTKLTPGACWSPLRRGRQHWPGGRWSIRPGSTQRSPRWRSSTRLG